MFDRFENRYHFTARLVATTGLHIGAGASLEPVGTDNPVMKDAQDRPYIPGSSFKGVLRARLESLVRGLGKNWSCDPIVKANWCVPSEENDRLKDQNKDDDNAYTSSLLKETCQLCQLFGSPWLASKVGIGDLYLHPDTDWSGFCEVRDGVAIDRDTETAKDKGKYDYEVVPAGTAFQLKIMAENISDKELGLLFIGLREFEMERAALGGITSRGLGRVKLDWEEIEIVERTNDSFLDYLKTGKGRILKPAPKEKKEEKEEVPAEPAFNEEDYFKQAVEAVKRAKEKGQPTKPESLGQILSEKGLTKDRIRKIEGVKNITSFLEKAKEKGFLIESNGQYDLGPKAEEQPPEIKEEEPIDIEQQVGESETIETFIEEKIRMFVQQIEGGEADAQATSQ